MSITGIASARHKLARAMHHIADLDEQVGAFTKANPIEVHAFWEPSQTHPGEVDCHMIALTEPPEVPEEWSLITGDALTCMRAALDHSVYPHARQFPTLTARTKPNGDLITIRQAHSAAVTDVLERNQPYHSQAPHHHAIAVLAALVNTDKHRQLLVTNGFAAQVLIKQSDKYVITYEDPQQGESLAKGDVLTRYRLKPTGIGATSFEYHKYLQTEPAIDLPNTTDYRPLIPLLRDIHSSVSEIVDKLAEAGLT
ncbi:hypothetical protein SAMN04244553_3611 [Nocardia amikacinitolerans]|uniref:Uncharacterized protein n=1 Tax=Nocardia amikacinitolerans TaxID=756689 RepID=A0A285LLK7_9NOCA|nr:hypothetical protein [Nocardia amikacinitolerans]SNY84251.1 hypothetical protein SAMN04244553_3611 [Nocardia amikacinitolerans]